ncbi:Uncharacterised protein [Dermatophilus congolensis]|uniref:Uncharacterized protein n=1 Tax=Dermatophilus congolensis TaxID=1863 RepID=A0AA46H0Q6_9MICO|nr:Uncharacterised protein [Dermatophilus congolensis]
MDGPWTGAAVGRLLQSGMVRAGPSMGGGCSGCVEFGAELVDSVGEGGVAGFRIGR